MSGGYRVALFSVCSKIAATAELSLSLSDFEAVKLLLPKLLLRLLSPTPPMLLLLLRVKFEKRRERTNGRVRVTGV